jgi:hypothetical protein
MIGLAEKGKHHRIKAKTRRAQSCGFSFGLSVDVISV